MQFLFPQCRFVFPARLIIASSSSILSSLVHVIIKHSNKNNINTI